jgi:translocation and assembly module TamB
MIQRIKHLLLAIRLKKFLLISSVVALAVLLLFVAVIAALPSLLSTPSVQRYVRTSLSKTLKRQVTWSTLNISWSNGVELKGLVLGSGPAPLLNLSMGEMTLVPKVSHRDGRMRMDLSIRCRNISAESAPGPPKPPTPFKEPLTAIAEAVQTFEGMDWPLPVDLGITMAVDPVNLAYHDPKSGRRLALGNLAFHFEAPSLADKPIIVDLRSNLAVDGHPLKTISLSADLKRLVTASRRIHPASALIALKADLPGSSLTIQGGLREPEGFAAKFRVQLPRTMVAYGPLLPKPAPALQGDLALDLLARSDRAQNLHISTEMSGSRLVMSGGPLRKGRLGPLNLQLRQKIVSDRQKQQVRFTDGSARIDNLLTASWDATVDRPSSKDRDLTARLGQVRVDLKQALDVAGPLLPAQFPVRELSGELTLRQLSAQLQGRKNRGEVSLDKLGITMPRFRLTLAKGGVSADGVELAIDRATVHLEARQPIKVDATLSYALRRCAVSGAQPVVAEGLRGMMQLALKDLDLKSRSPRKVAANVELRQSLDLSRVNVERKLTVNTLHQQTTALIQARESGEIEVTLPELKVSAASLQVSAAGKQLKPLPLTAVVTAAGIRLGAAKGARPVVERATCTLAGGDFLQLSARGALSGGSPQVASTDGTARVNLDRILPLAAPFLPKGAVAGGTTSVTWSLAAPTVQQPLSKTKNPLARAKAALGMLDRAEINVMLDNRRISWPLKSGNVTIADLRTTQPLRVVVPEKSGKITLAGDIAFAGLGGLSGSSGKLPVQSGSLSLQGELAGWQSLKLREELRAQPFGLVQKADATISRIDLLLEKQGPLTASVLLQQLDAVATADLEAHFPATPTPVPGGAELSGESRARAELTLAAGHDLHLRATAATRDFGVRLTNGTTIEGVHADLLVDRTYALSKDGEPVWSPLSVSLVRPLPEASVSAGGTEIVSRVREDLRGQESGSRKFTIRRLVIKNGGTPLELTSLEGDLLLGPDEMGLSFFQSEVIGGTVRLRSMIDLKPEIPNVSTACSFTNLKTLLLLSPDARRKSAATGQDTDITGEVSFDAPLQTGQRELLEGFTMRLNLRKIGADTLERALFSLDPNERNEQIVAQRKMLRYGSLQVLRASILDGAFSLEGDVKVKGVQIALPKVERLRLSELQIQKQMAKTLAGISSLRKLLDLARADTLIVGPTGKFSLVRRGHE